MVISFSKFLVISLNIILPIHNSCQKHNCKNWYFGYHATNARLWSYHSHTISVTFEGMTPVGNEMLWSPLPIILTERSAGGKGHQYRLETFSVPPAPFLSPSMNRADSASQAERSHFLGKAVNVRQETGESGNSLFFDDWAIVFCIHTWWEINRQSLMGGQFPWQWPIRRTLEILAKSTCLTTQHTDMDSKVIWSNKLVSYKKNKIK